MLHILSTAEKASLETFSFCAVEGAFALRSRVFFGLVNSTTKNLSRPLRKQSSLLASPTQTKKLLKRVFLFLRSRRGLNPQPPT